MAKLMEKESTNGPKEVRFMMVSGNEECVVVSEFGESQEATTILDSGRITRQMDTECTPGQMVTGMKVNGKFASSMAKGQRNSPMERFMLENIRTVILKDKESILGLMETLMKEALKMA
jgi:hypothetical protein